MYIIYILLGTTSTVNTVSLISDIPSTVRLMTSVELTTGISNCNLYIYQLGYSDDYL